ncbi:hypothetical protein [Pedobacter glucosidilyticus]|uniref:hypothetical protein n=1 Tax=Pedobacter glucosidilyticus TaxID=1122941 RepID=UPI0026EC8EDB|nr:hypothetical protein [Pedobacter glucosidilyticus]
MKSKFLKLVMGFALIGAIVTGCSSTKDSTNTTDSTGTTNPSGTDTTITAPSGGGTTNPTDSM